MILEAALHGDNAFATLTYSEEKLPDDLSVRPSELCGFVKRLRKRGYKFRYFGVGEYGDDSGRPHYHLSIFGFPSCAWGITRKQDSCCSQCDAVREAWGRGQILLGTLEAKSMAYVAGYINKKMTREDDPRLEGRRPEFARMSLRPGIGQGMMHEVASSLMEYNLEDVLIDVPLSLMHGEQKWPLSRYLRRELRSMIGRSKNAPLAALEEQSAALQDLRVRAFALSKPLRQEVLEASQGRRIQIEASYKRKKKVTRL